MLNRSSNSRLFLLAAIIAAFGLMLCIGCGGGGDTVNPTPSPMNTVAVAGNSAVQISWEAGAANPTRTGFRVYRGDSASGPFALIQEVGDVRTWTDHGVLNGETYWYRVTALYTLDGEITESGQTGAFPAGGATPAPTRPMTPPNVVAIPGDEQVTLQWDPISGLDSTIQGYKIYRSLTPDGLAFHAIVPNPNAVSFLDLQLVNGTTYYYYVVSYDASNEESLPSPVVNATPRDTIAPEAPRNFRGSPGNERNILLWDASISEDVVSYTLYLGSFTSLMAEVPGDQTSYVHEPIINDEEYLYWIDAVDKDGNHSSVVGPVSLTPTDMVPPLPPVDVAAEDLGDSVKLTWRNPPVQTADVNGFSIARAQSPDGPFTGGAVIAPLVKDYVFVDEEVNQFENYWYLVRTVDISGLLSLLDSSSPVGASPGPPMAPNNVTGIAGDSAVNLDWIGNDQNDVPDDLLDLAGYEIWREGDAPGFIYLSTVLAADETYEDTNVLNYVTYNYYIKAVDSFGHVSEASNTVAGMYPVDSTGPNPPQNLVAYDTLKADGAVSLRVNLSWHGPEEGTGDLARYEILRSADGLGDPNTWSVVDTTTGTEEYYVDRLSLSFEGMTTYYAVRAVDIANPPRTSLASAVATVVPGSPMAPVLDVPGVDCDSLLFNWAMDADAGLGDLASFRLLRSKDGGPFMDVVPGIAANLRSIADTTVVNGQEYTYYLLAYDEIGNVSEPSMEVQGMAHCGDNPLPPTNIQAFDTLNGIVDVLITWTPSIGFDVEGYMVYRGQNGMQMMPVADLPPYADSFLDDGSYLDGLEQNQTYYYLVKAYKDIQVDGLPTYELQRVESLNELTVWATPGAPDAPANAVAVLGDDSVSLTWTPVDEEPWNRSAEGPTDPTTERNKDLLQYEIWRALPGQEYHWLGTTGVNNYLDTDVQNEQAYRYWIRTRDASGHISRQKDMMDPLDFEYNEYLKPPELFDDNYITGVVPTDGLPLPVGGVACTEALTARSGTALDSVIITWLPSEDEELAGYNVYRSTEPYAGYELIGAPIGGTVFTDDLTSIVPFLPNPNNVYTRYYYYVAAVDKSGKESLAPAMGDPASSTFVSCVPGEPDAPLALTGFAGNGLVTLSWDPTATTATDVTGFRIYRYQGDPLGSNNPDDPANYSLLVQLDGVLSSSFVDDDGVLNNNPYWYAITSFDAVGNETLFGDWTRTDPELVPSDEMPNPPTGFTAVEVFNNITDDYEAHLSWNQSQEDDIAFYNVYRNGMLLGSAGFNTVYVDVPPAWGEYTYWVTAVDEDLPPNESGPSNAVELLIGDPDAPSALGIDNGDQTCTLSWSYDYQSSWDVVGFKVYRRELFEGGGTGALGMIAEVGLTDIFTDDEVLNEHGYEYVVTAVDGADNESQTTAANSAFGWPTDGAPDAPANVEVIADVDEIEGHYFRIKWDQNFEIDLEGYRVYRRTVGAAWPSSPIAEVSAPFTEYFDYSGIINGNFYEYGVTAFDIQWNSPVDGHESIVSPPSNAVERLDPNAPSWNYGDIITGDTVIMLAWFANTEPDLDSYRLFRGTASNDLYFIDDVPGDQLTYLDHDLVNGTDYWYGITAVDIFGNESPMTVTEDPLIPSSSPPIPPDNVEVYNDDGSSFFLDWDNNYEPDVIGYNVYRNGNGPEEIRYADGEGSMLEDDGSLAFGPIVADTAYFYTVHAVDIDSFGADREGAGSTSNGVEIGAPAIPTGLNDDGVGDEFVSFSWNPISVGTYPDFAGFKVYRDDNPVSSYAFIADAGFVTSFTDYGLVNEHDYRYAVSSYDIFGNESALSAGIDLTPTDGPPLPPYNVEITADDGTMFRCEWDPSQSEDTADYQIRRVDNGVAGAAVNTGSVYLWNDVFATSTWGTPAGGVDVYYQVRAIDEGGNIGDWSHADNSTCVEIGAPGVPVGLAQVSGDEVVALSWTANAECDLAGYNVYRDGSYLAEVMAPVVTYTDDEVENGLDYTYTVRAFDVFANESLDSAGVVGSPNDGPPLAVDNCAVTQDAGTGPHFFRIEWDANHEHDILRYEVSRSNVPGTWVSVGLNTWFVDDHGTGLGGFLNNSAYTYSVRAVDQDLLAGPACTTQAVEEAEPFGADIPVTVTNGDGWASVSWTDSDVSSNYVDLAGYNVYLTELGGSLSFVGSVAYNPTGNSYLFDSLMNEVVYDVDIRPYDTFGNEGVTFPGGRPSLAPTNGHPTYPDWCQIYADDGSEVSFQWVAPNNDTALAQYVVRRYYYDEDTSTWDLNAIVSGQGGGTNWETGLTATTFTDDGSIWEAVPGSDTAGFVDEWLYRYEIAADDNADPVGVTRLDDMNYCMTTNCVELGAPMVMIDENHEFGGDPGFDPLVDPIDNRFYYTRNTIDGINYGEVAYILWNYQVDFGGPDAWDPYSSANDTVGDDDDNYSRPCDVGGWKIFITLHDEEYVDRSWQLLIDIPNTEISSYADHAVLDGGTYCYHVAMYDVFGNVVLPVDGPVSLGGTRGDCITIDADGPTEPGGGGV